MVFLRLHFDTSAPDGHKQKSIPYLTLSGPRILQILLKHWFVRAPKNIIREDLPKKRKASSPKDNFSSYAGKRTMPISLYSHFLPAASPCLHFDAILLEIRPGFFISRHFFFCHQKQSRCVLSMEELCHVERTHNSKYSNMKSTTPLQSINSIK